MESSNFYTDKTEMHENASCNICKYALMTLNILIPGNKEAKKSH